MSESPLIARRQKALSPSYRLFYDDPVHLVRGQGVWLFDAAGNRFLDCYNNVASVGHCHPHIVAALARQAGLLNTHTRYLDATVIEYSERLAAKLPGQLSVCLFVCTGSEANDLAMRIARAASGHEGAIVVEAAYHGNSSLVRELSPGSYGAAERPGWLAVIEPPNLYRGPFRTDDPGAAGKYAALIDDAIKGLEERGHRPAAFLVDSIFDSNGLLVAPKEYFPAVYAKVRAAGGLIIADEVQAGFCRTGESWWGFEMFGLMPDIVTLGKPMGAGHPLAAVVTTPAIAEAFAETTDYFNTFGGNPVSAAVGMAVLEVLEAENILENTRQVGGYLGAALGELAARHEIIGDLRGIGLFYGLELVHGRDTRDPAPEAARRLANLMRREGVLLGHTGRFGNVLKIRPPLVFSRDNADQLVETLDRALAALEGTDGTRREG